MFKRWQAKIPKWEGGSDTMFSKSRINEPAQTLAESNDAPVKDKSSIEINSSILHSPTKKKPAASFLSADLHVKGNLETVGELLIEGEIDGDIRAHLLTIGQGATVRGELIADDVVVNGHIIGRVRGLKVRLSATARVEGDIIHHMISIEAGAHFEGAVHRQNDPLTATIPKGLPQPTLTDSVHSDA
jgi:cytoskeletal protein CcmA (bactofilin family)